MFENREFRPPPGPRGLPLLGSFLDVQRDPLGLFGGAIRDHGPTVRFRFGPYHLVLINRPEDIRHVFVENHGNYRKSPSYQILKAILGEGLLTSEGSFWRRQRKLAQPAFHHKSLVGFADTMSQLAAETAESIAQGPGTINLHTVMMRLTLRIVGHTLMSTELDGKASQLSEALEVLLGQARSTESLLLLPPWVPTVGRYRVKRAAVVLDEIIQTMIDDRRRVSDPPADLLSMLLQATDETGTERMTDRQLRDELLTLVLAGHETTANALAWTFHLLSQHPAVDRRLGAEVQDVVGSGPVRFEHLEHLTYTEAVLKESMRLFPPAWIFERQAIAPDVVDGYPIEAGWIVAASPWTVHRDPTLYPNPTAFDPERFSPDNVTARSKYAYIPFGLGPRVCIGNGFAMMEAKIILASLIANNRFTSAANRPIKPDPGITLRPNGPMPMRVHPRP